MKITLRLFIALLMALALFSCREKTVDCISVDRSDFVFDFKSSSQVRTVAGGTNLHASSDQNWCAASLSDDEEGNLSVWVLANLDSEPRTAKITLSAIGCEDVVLQVVQSGHSESGEPYLVADKNNIKTENTEHSLYVTISTNQDDLEIISHPQWCVAELISDKKTENLKLDFKANTSVNGRSGKVVLRARYCEDLVIDVTQTGLGSMECELLSFEIKGSDNSLSKDISFNMDKAAAKLNAMYLLWIDKSDPEMLIPTFSFKGRKVMVGDVEVISGKTAISFADDFDLVVVAENGASKSYRVSLNCPQINRELAVLHMEPASEITSKNYYVSTQIELYDKTPGSTGEGWWDSSTQGAVEVRGRGNSTWGLPKKPYRLKFPQDYSPIGLNHTSQKSWTLLAHDMDKSLLRNALGFEISRELFDPSEGRHDQSAILFTPAAKFVNVYMSGKYHGVYQMSDQIERAKGRIAVEKLKAVDGSDQTKITGGYIVECDLHEGSWTSSSGVRWSIKYPEDDDYDPAQYRYIQNFINTAESALYGYDFKDAQNGWRKYFDEKTLVDFVIAKELAGDMDGFTSIYIYKRRGIDKFFFGPVWDVDKGWCNDVRQPHWEYPPKSSLMMYAGFWMNYRNPDWFHRFWKDETFRAAVNERWKQKKDELVALINDYLDEKQAGMYKAVRANFGVTEERDNWDGFAENSSRTTCPWPWNYQNCSDAPLPQRNYDAEIQYIRDKTAERVKVLDREFAK